MSPPAQKPDPRRTAYNWIFRVLDDRTKAKAVLARLPDDCLERTPADVLPEVKRLLTSELEGPALTTTIFGQAHEQLADLPALEPLPAGSKPGEVADPRERFRPAVRGVIELCLVDRIPIEAVAAHLEVGPDMLRSFLGSVLDLLGDLSSIPLTEGSPHVMKVIEEEIRAHQGGAVASAEEPAALRGRCREVIAVLAQDRRILSMSSDQLVRKALAGPKVQVAGRKSWIETAFKGLTPKAPPPAPGEEGAAPVEPVPRGVPWKPVLTGFLAIALIGGLVVYEGLGPGAPPAARTSGGDPSKVLGTFSTPGHRRQPLVAGSRLEAPPSGHLAISFFAGCSVVGKPPSSLEVAPGTMSLGRGEFRVWSEWPLKEAFVVKIRNLKLDLTNGSIEVRVDSEGAVRVSGVQGKAILSEPADQTREIGPGDRLEQSADGKISFVPAAG